MTTVVDCINHLQIFIEIFLSLTNKRAWSINYSYITYSFPGRVCLSCVESQGPLPCSQYPAAGLNPEPFESNSYSF